MSPEREEELLVGEGFGTQQEAENYFSNITRKNCKDDNEGEALFINCQYSKDCVEQANTESDCIIDIAKVCKYNENYEGRRCVNHMMAHIKFYRDYGTGGLGPYQIAQGLTRKDIRDQKEEEEGEDEEEKKGKKSKKRNMSNRAESAQEGSEEKDPSGLSSLLGGNNKNRPSLLGSNKNNANLLGGKSGKGSNLLGGKGNGASLLG